MESGKAKRFFRPRNIVLALVALGTISYATEQYGRRDRGPAGEPSPVPLMEGFVSHRDTAGFTVEGPSDWRVLAPRLTEISIVSPDGNSAALIRARVARGDLAAWLAKSYAGTETGMKGLTVMNVAPAGPNVAHASLRWRQGNTDKVGSVVAVRQGEIATVFVGLAPADEFAAQLPRLASILGSFRFNPPDSAVGHPPAPRASTRFVQWVDPYEQAFSFQIPAGWQPQGGLLRRADGVRVAWQISAPDQSAFIFGGDQSLPAYFVFPTQIALSLGNREGYPTGPGGPIMLRFQDAMSMGRTVIQQRFGQVQVVSVRERPDLIETLKRSPILRGSQLRMSAAELEFRLADGRTGMMALTTHGQEVADLGGTWYVDNIHGFVAPAARVPETAMALAQAIGTSQENPNWRAGEAEHQARMTAQFQEYHTWSANLQRASIEARWASDQARQGDMRDILGGTVRLKDPVTGETFETGGQSRYYYRVAQSNTGVGVETDYNPAPEVDMRRLLQIGVDTPGE